MVFPSTDNVTDNAKKYESYTERPNGDYHKIYSINGIRYEECRFTYEDGDRYEGPCKNALPHGKGIRTCINGNRYEGDWKDGKATGTGKMIYANGNRYEGGLTEGIWNGYGKFTFNSGSHFEGMFVNGIIFKEGVILLDQGDTYTENMDSKKKSTNDELDYR